MSVELEHQGFSPATEWVWERLCSWKREWVHVLDLGGSVLVNFYVGVPCYTGAPEPLFEMLAIRGLGHILGERRPDFRIPTYWGRSRFTARMVERLRVGLSWFDQFDSPGACLAVLRADEKRRGTPAFMALEAFLAAHG